jgi:hypothetical protein
MQTEMCKTMSSMTHQALENWKTIGETNLKLFEKLFQSQVDLATSLVDVLTMNGEEISQTKDVKEIASLQAEIAQVSGKLIMENAQSTADIIAEAGKVYGELCTTALKSGSDFAKSANTSKAKKAAA